MPETLTKGDQTRAEIMTAAQKLFLSKGYNGTSMRDIARTAGNRAVAGIYNHFPNKEAIFRALIEEQSPYPQLLDQLQAIADTTTTAPEYLAQAMQLAMTVLPQHYDFLQLAQIDAREFQGRTVTHVLQDIAFPRLLAIVQQVQTREGLKEANPIIWLRIFASLLLGYVITDRLAPQLIFGAVPREEWPQHFVHVLLYGIAEE